ncbi:MAG: carbohydrate kinase family protein, partial [Anaerolineales bacterium]
MDFVTFGIILDNIVFPDGRIARDVLGGGGVQTAFGMRLWSDAQRVGLVANVGTDLPESVWDWLRASGVDGLGVRVSKMPTLRAWEHLDAAGRRTHLWAAPAEVVEAQLQRSLVYVPQAYHRARGFHLGLHPDSPDHNFLADLRTLGGLVSVEPFKPADQRPTPEALRALLSAADVFSPNLNGARSLVGPGKPPELTQRLIDSGARVVALRMGAQGSFVTDAEGGRSAHIPAFPVNVHNPVGAGNAY